MPPLPVLIHLATILPAAVLGTYLLLARKGSPIHRQLGKAYMTLMGFTAVWTLFLPAEFGPRLWNHFGMLHLLSVLTAWTVPTAWRAARRGDIRGHRSAMIQLYVGGILIAGAFAVLGQGRYLNQLLFS
ncbi:MAG: DUF2306 domain-containing protein [Schleiferiaceae bacterium]